jgi:acyl dehydratase
MGFLLPLLIVVAVLYLLYKFVLGYAQESPQVVRNPEPYPTLALLSLGALRGLVKRSGVLEGPVSGTRLVWDVKQTPEQIERFERATVFAGGKASAALTGSGYHTQLSATFPQMLSVRPSASLIVSRAFPLSPLGVIHITQTITQHRDMPAGGSYLAEVKFARYANGLMFNETDKGVELTLRVTLVDRKKNNEAVWEGDTVILSRGAQLGKRGGPAPVFEKPVWEHQSTHAVSDSTGRTYAAASGDYNPHHLFWWSALPMGFRRPIAHGMWTLSAALNELLALKVTRENVFPLRVSCDFKKPLLMPATVTFGYSRRGDTVHFGVYDKNNVDPHLIGQLTQ